MKKSQWWVFTDVLTGLWIFDVVDRWRQEVMPPQNLRWIRGWRCQQRTDWATRPSSPPNPRRWSDTSRSQQVPCTLINKPLIHSSHTSNKKAKMLHEVVCKWTEMCFYNMLIFTVRFKVTTTYHSESSISLSCVIGPFCCQYLTVHIVTVQLN